MNKINYHHKPKKANCDLIKKKGKTILNKNISIFNNNKESISLNIKKGYCIDQKEGQHYI